MTPTIIGTTPADTLENAVSRPGPETRTAGTSVPLALAFVRTDGDRGTNGNFEYTNR